MAEAIEPSLKQNTQTNNSQAKDSISDAPTHKPLVGYLGPPGTYTHQAVLQDWPESQFHHVPLEHIQDVVAAVQQRKVHYGIVPFENSTAGSVTTTLDLLADRHNLYPNVNVCGECFVAIHHMLLGKSNGRKYEGGSGAATPTELAPSPLKPKSQPLINLSHIRSVYTHSMAWGQCEAFLQTYLKNVERNDCSSTSKGAEIVSKRDSNESASISCVAAATAHNLDVLAMNIEDNPNNKTRFLTLRYHSENQSESSPIWSPPPSEKQKSQTTVDMIDKEKQWKTLVAFKVNHNLSGALSKALQVFSDHSLNLTSMHSRPSGEISGPMVWHYIFFVEFLGCIGDEKIEQAMKKLVEVTEGYKLIGSFPNRSIDVQGSHASGN